MNGTIHHRFNLSLLSFFVFNTSASCVSTSCTCDGGRPQGQYCGADFVDPNCIYDQCNPQGQFSVVMFLPDNNILDILDILNLLNMLNLLVYV
uniref:Uncharacterized protein n=1 Tax=Rhizophagus irregularis (strain DAOM 181602 / DAOM 197198 / MUCL 43194) TaxID=747089 RepID=U9ULC4_RHIID